MDQSGAVTDRYVYRAFGAAADHSGASDTRRTFVGQQGIVRQRTTLSAPVFRSAASTAKPTARPPTSASGAEIVEAEVVDGMLAKGTIAGQTAAKPVAPEMKTLSDLAKSPTNPKSAPNITAWSQVSSDYRAVIRDVEAHTRRSIPNVQRRQLSNQIREVNHRQPVSDDAYRTLQAEYRDNRSALIEAWERNTGQNWPQGVQTHHIIPSRYCGPKEWWNIHLAYRDVHQPGIHGSGSPTQTVFPTPLPRN